MHVRRAIWPAALVVAIVGIRAQSHAPGVAAYAELQALEAQLLASRSATQTLEAWCRDHRLADTPRIVARRVDADTRPPTAEQRRRLELAADEPVRYRVNEKPPAFLRGGRNVPARSVRSMRRWVQ